MPICRSTLALSALCLALSVVSGCGKEELIDETPNGGDETGNSGANGSGGDPGPCTPGETEACYTGPEGTAGVGVCKVGTRVCNADGSGFGGCVGEVVPSAENCVTPQDESCDGMAPSCGSDTLWSRRFGEGEGYGVVVGPDGNPVVVGRFSSSINFGGNTLSSAGGYDAFVAKLDGSSGEHIWSRRLGGSDDQTAWSVGLDAQGDVVVVGEFIGEMSVGGGNTLSSAGGNDIFVVKYDGADGSHIWSKRFGDSMDQIARGVSVGPSGDVVITGSFNGNVDFGTGAITSAGSFDLFVAKLDAQGGGVYATRYGDSDEQNGHAIAIEPSGGAVITGDFRGAMSLGATTLTSTGSFDAFVARVDASGKPVYAKGYGSKNHPQRGYAVAVAPSGNALVSGLVRGDVDFGGGSLSAKNLDVFLLQLDPSGGHVHSKLMGGKKADNPGGVALGANGKIIVTGGIPGEGNFDGTAIAAGGGFDAFVARFDSSGSLKSAVAYGDASDQFVNAVATDAAGRVFIAAQVSGTVDFGTGTLWGAEGELVLAKLQP
ncbi:hypothetical protein [Polyangium aurulentum]|uniref:hypothetical protein n=1 Tax=Polyangium aurulentum TaxID=2567896 RepID=UPI0010AE0F5E|nr:hypothetical protein [Polyangium aurulentum]UQA56074.1 hypothetical protein E8A73_032800 [Polyangium aurulentum]